MIGQQANLTLIKRLLREGRLQHFIIIHGGKMSGKKAFASEIVKELGMSSAVLGDSIDAVREMIDDCYKSQHERAYLLYDLETYNYRSLEAILKISEEPPAFSYIIVTVNNLSFLKETVKNRAFIINIMPYSFAEMRAYIQSRRGTYKLSEFGYQFINTPSLYNYYIVDRMLGKYKDFFRKFGDILTVTGSESLKVSGDFNLKVNDNDKLDFGLFLDWLGVYLVLFAKSEGKNVSLLVSLLLRFKAQMRVNGVNMYALVNSFIIAFRLDCKKSCIQFGDFFERLGNDL